MIKEHRLIQLADLIAESLLERKLDKQGRPLIEHARRVEQRCQNLSTEQRCAALLHDCIEEQHTRPLKQSVTNTIFLLYGWSTLKIVRALTRLEGQSYEYYIHSIPATCPDAIPVKLADLEDNLDPSRGPIPDSLRDRYLKAKSYLESLRSLRSPASPANHANHAT